MTIDLPGEPAHVMRKDLGAPGQEAAFVLVVHGDLAHVTMMRKVVKEALQSLKASMEPPPCRGCGDDAGS